MTTLEWIAGKYAGIAFLAWLAGACALGWSVGRLLDERTADPARRGRRLAGLAATGIVLFGIIATLVVTESRLVALDNTLAETLSNHASASWLRALATLTVAGDRDFLLVLGAFVLTGLLWRRRWVDASLWLSGTLGAAGLNVLLKGIFQRVRPEHLHGFAQELGWSFPSGHATGAMAVYGLSAYLVADALPGPWRRSVAVAATALIASIGYSRVMLQVHFLSDVLAAFAVTGAWITLCIALRERVLAMPPSRSATHSR